jgi:hypothetical protein
MKRQSLPGVEPARQRRFNSGSGARIGDLAAQTGYGVGNAKQ